MSKVFIILEDVSSGIEVTGLTQHRTDHDDSDSPTPAEQLNEFLAAAAKLWIDTKNMSLQGALAHVQSITKPATKEGMH